MKLKKAIKFATENDCDGVCVQANGDVVMFYGNATFAAGVWFFDDANHIIGKYTGKTDWRDSLHMIKRFAPAEHEEAVNIEDIIKEAHEYGENKVNDWGSLERSRKCEIIKAYCVGHIGLLI